MKKIYLILLILLISSSLALADAVLTLSVGKVYVKKENGTKWTPAKINMTLSSSDMVRVGKKSRAVIKLSNGTLYTITEMKSMNISKIEEQSAKSTGKKSIGQLLKEKGIKLSKSSASASGVTAVAGVRGADVDSQKNKIKPKDIKWKE